MKHFKGFTLIEIMVVVVILGILAAIVVPNVTRGIVEARIQAAKSDIRTIESALTLYKIDNYRYPTTEQGLIALIERPSAADAPNWNAEGYLKKLPTDPWGNPYLYTSDGARIEFHTLGSDSQPGGESEAGDIRWADL
jgi:general secretion pathway protein G